jgi:hypothetical protein
MVMFVVGSGRCGTKSVAAAFVLAGIPAGHETDLRAVLPLQHAYVTGILDTDTVAETIRTACRFREVEASYVLTGLIEPLAQVYPDAEFLHVTRDPEDTADSMVRNGWYDPADDWQWPTMWSWITPEGMWSAADHPGYRITAPWVGECTWKEWRQMPQWDRCRWWIDWTHRRLDGIQQLPIESGRLIINGREVTIPHIS